VAGAALGIDPFDEPNVQESKDNTNRVLAQYEQTRALPAAGDTGATVERLRQHIDTAREGDYIAILAYVTPNPENHAALQALRVAIRDATRRATTLGFGPRYLHSTGQLHKGGPNTGVFIEITCDDATDVSIPGKPYTFSILKQAQAAGDLESLRAHERRVIRMHISGGLVAAIDDLRATLAVAAAAR